MFFPSLARRDQYVTKPNGDYYADYHHYEQEITEDCQQRCVYCDITMMENGGEGMQLDHFRPQKHFIDLGSDPLNLVLSCAGCNRLKSAHWPMGKTNGSHDGVSGFVDPFAEDRTLVFEVSKTGAVTAIKGPGHYMIELLHLNRPSRSAIRFHRQQVARLRSLSIDLGRRMNDLHVAMNEKTISFEDAATRLGILKALHQAILKLQWPES